MHPVPLLAVSVSNALAVLPFDALAGMIMLYAAVRVARAPRDRFSYGRFSKLLWLIIALLFNVTIAGVIVPLGTFAALWHMRSLSRLHDLGHPEDVPFAAGTSFEPEEKQ